MGPRLSRLESGIKPAVVWRFSGALQPHNSVAFIEALIATFIENRACLKTDATVREVNHRGFWSLPSCGGESVTRARLGER
jgi:hypothetical protein